jgi:tetratricopeptide (TPR) repeat protein
MTRSKAILALGYSHSLLHHHRIEAAVADGWAALDADNLGQAATLVTHALELSSKGSAGAWALLSAIYLRLEQQDNALHAARLAAERDADNCQVALVLGRSLITCCRYVEADAVLRRGLYVASQRPTAASIHGGLHHALALNLMAESDCCSDAAYLDAETHYVRAMAIYPARDGRFNHAVSRLLRGLYDRTSWEYYEERFFVYSDSPIINRTDYWDMSPLDGRTLLLDCDGGMGDVLQFGRYAHLAKAAGGRVIAVMSERLRRLVPLLSSCGAIDEVILTSGRDARKLPPFDFGIPVMSFPLIAGTTLDNIPDARWLPGPSEAKREAARAKIRHGGLKVGLSWHSSSDDRRNIQLAIFHALATVPGVRLFGLQRGDAAKQIEEVSFPVMNLENAGTDILDTVANMMEMDVVVSVDSMTCHLAGMFGVRTFTLLPARPDWRWILGRDDSPWYPGTMRLFRQMVPGDWAGPVAAVVEAVRAMAAER